MDLPFHPSSDHPDDRAEPLRVLYRDDQFVAVDKPAGLFSHPSPLDRRAPSALEAVRAAVGGPVHSVHRLDRATSGVLLFTLSSEAASGLCRQFRLREVDKRYLAVVRGFAADEGTVDYPLREEAEAPLRSAVTEFRRLATAVVATAVGRYDTARYSLVALRPLTGRRHQLRRHLAHLRHPVVGDSVYGDGRHNRLFRERFGARHLFLFAEALSFEHPFRGERVLVRAPLPPTWRGVFSGLGWTSLSEMGEGPQGAPRDGVEARATGVS